MNVRKLVGRGLIGVGLLLMMIGTASVPSTSWAAALPALGAEDCKGTCNRCGTAVSQPGGKYKCFRQENGVSVYGNCSQNGVKCALCTGDCNVEPIGGNQTCVCDRK